VLAVRAFPGAGSFEDNRADPIMSGFHRWAGVPIINMESARWHPCQALADWATLDQHQVPKPAKLVLSWAWHPKPLPHAVPNSTACMAAQRGMEVVLLCPPGLELHPEVIAEAQALATLSGGSFRVSHDREEALAHAAVVYAKSWGSIQNWGDLEAETSFRAGLRDWCVTPAWLGNQARFFHCLPVRRNVVVADAVLDGPQSCVIDQAEHRLHAQTALLESLLS
jgi:N-acetylornithine carbamoyltransferase